MGTLAFQFHGPGLAAMLNDGRDLNSDTLAMTMHGPAYTPDPLTHGYVSSLTSELATGGGYTAGGKTLTGVTSNYVPANTFTVTRAASTTYNVGDVVRPATGNGYLYRCTIAGTTGASLPTYPTTVGVTVADGTVTWTCVGRGAIILTAANVSWAGPVTAGPVHSLVISDRTPGTAATQPILASAVYTADETGAGGSWDVSFPASGFLYLFVH